MGFIDRDEHRRFREHSYSYPYGFDKDKFEATLFAIMGAFDDDKLIEREMLIGEIEHLSLLFVGVIGRDITASQLAIGNVDYFITRIVSCFAEVKTRFVMANDRSVLREILNLDVTDPAQAELNATQDAWYREKFPDPRLRDVAQRSAIVDTLKIIDPTALKEVRQEFIHIMQDTSTETVDFGELFDVFAEYFTRLVNGDFTRERFDIKLDVLYDKYRNKRGVRKPSLMEKHLVGRVSKIYKEEKLRLGAMLEVVRQTREMVEDELRRGTLLQHEKIPMADRFYSDEYAAELDELKRKIEAVLATLF